MGGGLQKSFTSVLGRRALLGGGISTTVLTLVRASRANSYAMFRVRAPYLEARFEDWWKEAEKYAQDLVTSEHPSVIRFRHRLTEISNDLGLIQFFGAVNHIVNTAAPYVEDYKSGRGRDQWASPIEFLERGGDCEDFALTKAATLYCLGWPFDSTYLLVGELTHLPKKRTGHAVLVVVLDDRQDRHLVLDSISDRVVSFQHYHNFRPIYGLDRRGAMMFVPPLS